ncbi:hypothetical protein [Candidatus Accumulibacter sp. ACC003]|uniref:hypothetical protein n=1 Tax=Candidatus Accumulibacter sp. ACC003 TaxID=2823334 RepID=UPI0025C46CAC|nr:hypothetical protein [Candidatus Accumulibacter sp. ACC003]
MDVTAPDSQIDAINGDKPLEFLDQIVRLENEVVHDPGGAEWLWMSPWAASGRRLLGVRWPIIGQQIALGKILNSQRQVN